MTLPSVLQTPPIPLVPSDPLGPHIIAHRGGAALAPENTLIAFEQAVGLGCSMLETDVQLTADGVAVAFHDETLDRVTNLQGSIRSFTLAELRRAEVYGPSGQVGQIATMSEVLDAFPDVRWAIDLKNGDSIVPLAEAVNKTKSAPRICVAHAWESWLDRVRELTDVRMERSLGWREMSVLVSRARAGLPLPDGFPTGAWAHLGWRPGGVPLMESEDLASRIISLSRGAGMGVRVWTINDEKQMTRLLAQGVDGIFTDRPDIGLLS